MFDPKTKILVIDDMSTMRAIVSKFCRDFGMMDITTAADGEQAWELINSSDRPFDLIISDWNMPRCSGLDLLKRVRGDVKFKNTPFLMVTAEGEKGQILEALKSGVDQYLMKPFNQENFRAKLDAVAKKYKKAG